ncbi:MAG: amidohydrolase family protein, partial [Candidatus Eremiobacterota bacterium]
GRPDLSFGPGHLLFPGFGDLHVHLRYGQPHKETFQTGVAAALNGGVTFMLDMPNNPDPPVTPEGIRAKREAAGDLPVDLDFYAGVGPETRPFEHPFYKAYVAASIGPLYFENEGQLEGTLQHYAGRRVTFHCEDPEILRECAGEPEHEDRRPPQAEVRAIETVLRLARRYGFRVHVAHLSTARGLERLRAEPGDKPLCEVGPHHLYFDRENRKKAARSGFLKMNPPLRSPRDRQRLLEGFARGEIDFLATDHAPHTVAEKESDNPSGVPLLDTYGAFVAWLLHQGMPPEHLARHCCLLPGRFMGRPVGRLSPGFRGHVAVLNLESPWTVRAEDCRTACGWSPFEGETLPGRVELTVASGRLFRGGLEWT